MVREWAAVASVPSRTVARTDLAPDRSGALGVRPTQGRVFGDGAEVTPVAVVSHDGDRDGQARLEWQRGNVGTVAHGKRVLNDELAAGGVSERHGRGACGRAAAAGVDAQPAGTAQGGGGGP